TGTLQDDRQPSRMSEGIRIEANLDIYAEYTLAVLLAIKRVPNKALGCWNITIWLHWPRANNLPAILPDTFSYLRKHDRVGTFCPAVVCGRRMTVAEARRLVHPV